MKISALILAFVNHIIDRAKGALQSAVDALVIDEKEVTFEVAFGDLFTGTTESRVATAANDDTSAIPAVETIVEKNETATAKAAPTCAYTLYEIGKPKLCGRILVEGEVEICAKCAIVKNVLAKRRANDEARLNANPPAKTVSPTTTQFVMANTAEGVRAQLEHAYNNKLLAERFPQAKVCGRAEGSYMQPIALVFNGRMQSFLIRDEKRFQEVEASKSLKASSGGGRPRIDAATAAARKATAAKQAEGSSKKKEKGQKVEGGKQHKRAANGR